MANRRGVAVTVWLCAGILTLTTVVSCFGDAINVHHAQPPTHTTSVVSQQTQASIDGSFILATDGRTLLYTETGSACPDPPLGVQEMATTVRLVRYTYPDGATCPLAYSAGTVGRIVLTKPLRRGRLIDDLTGRVIAVINETNALRLAHIPPYLFSASGSPLGDVVATAPGFSGGATLAEVFGATVGAPVPPGGQLWIVTSTGTWTPGGATVPVTVRRHAGLAVPGAIVWHEHGMTSEVRWQLPPNAATAVPTIASLVKLADALVGVSA